MAEIKRGDVYDISYTVAQSIISNTPESYRYLSHQVITNLINESLKDWISDLETEEVEAKEQERYE